MTVGAPEVRRIEKSPTPQSDAASRPVVYDLNVHTHAEMQKRVWRGGKVESNTPVRNVVRSRPPAQSERAYKEAISPTGRCGGMSECRGALLVQKCDARLTTTAV